MTRMKLLTAALAVTAALLPPAAAEAAGKLKVTTETFDNGQAVPQRFAFCVPAVQGHVGLGPDVNPALAWSGAPAGTKSFAVIAVDRDVPSVASDVNKEGKTIPRTLKRIPFYHWVLVDIPATVTTIAEGADSDKVTPRGKPPGPAKAGVRGVNDYTKWFASDQDMKGDYGGYDGPCPPWNDSIVHHYHFIVYALDVPSLALSGRFTGADAEKAMAGHVLARGEVMGTYTLSPKLMTVSSKK